MNKTEPGATTSQYSESTHFKRIAHVSLRKNFDDSLRQWLGLPLGHVFPEETTSISRFAGDLWRKLFNKPREYYFNADEKFVEIETGGGIDLDQPRLWGVADVVYEKCLHKSFKKILPKRYKCLI